MKHTQGVFFFGYVTIKVEGHHPELFFDLCARNGITVWNIKRKGDRFCSGNVKLADVPHVKMIRRRTIYKISFIHKKGIPFLSKRLFVHKAFIIGLIMSMVLVGLLSNIVWGVKIEGVHPEIEKRIQEQLNDYGIYPGALKFSIGSPSRIQKKLLDDIPELLWVGVTEKGTTYHLEGVERTVVEERKKESPRNLISSKEGVIVDMFISKGQPVVEVNDFVEEGDLLVSGVLGKKEEETSSSSEQGLDEGEKPRTLVAAEGEVIAQTWYEINVNIPLKANYETLTGEYKNKYYIRMGDFLLPIWGFSNPEFKQTEMEVNENEFYFLNWKLPISYVKQTIYEKNSNTVSRTKDEAKTTAIKQATQDLQKQLGLDAEIKFEKVLHERVENGKVKLTLYFTVLENIAKIQPIS